MATFGMFRFSFVQLWEPKAMGEGQAPKYSVQGLIDKKDTELASKIRAAIAAAVKAGINKGVFTEAQSKSKNFKLALRNGDEYYEESPGAARETCKGHLFVNAAAQADRQPAIVDSRAKPIMVRDDFYSGCYGYADINFYPYNKQGGMGIAAGLNSVLKKKDGERLDGRISAETAFANVIDQDEDEENGSNGQLT